MVHTHTEEPSVEKENRRQELHRILKDTLGSDEVYFQPPTGTRMCYPAIVYKLSDIYDLKADNNTYKFVNQYEMVLMHRDPDNDVYTKLIQLPMCRFVRYYAADNLNHYIYRIYY